MATVALAAVGSIFGPIGTIIGGALGSWIDNAFLFPALFGRPDLDVEGPRLDDLRLQLATEGSPINFVLGRPRVGATVLWIPDEFIEEKTVQHQGGKGGGPSQSQTTYSYFTHIAIAWCAGPINKVLKVWADVKGIYTNDIGGGVELFDDRYEELVHYFGTASQDRDPLIESFEGTNNTPAYRHIAYSRITKLSMGAFGNRIPSFTALLESDDGGLFLSTAVPRMLARSGFDASEYDVSRVSGTTEVRGYSIAGVTQGLRSIEPPAFAYDLAARESSGKMVFFHRGDEDVVAVDEDRLAAHEPPGNPPPPIELTDSDSGELALPTRVEVGYFTDAVLSRKKKDQSQSRQHVPFTHVVKQVNLPLVLGDDEARAVAKRRLWQAWIDRTPAAVSLPPRYLELEEGDIVQVPSDGELFNVRVSEITRGNNFLLEVKGVVESVATASYSSVSEGDDSPPDSDPLQAPDMTLLIVSCGPLRDEHAVIGGFYAAAAVTDPTATFGGATLFSSTDDVSFGVEQVIPVEGALCQALTTLGDVQSPYHWDRVNTVNVQMLDGELASATELSVLNGANRLWLGSELLGFQTATQLADGPNGEKRYTLSKLLRGLVNTEAETGTHATNEFGLLLSSTWMLFVPVQLGQVGSTRYYRAVSTNGLVEDETSEEHLLKARTLVPYSPVHAKGVRAGSNDLTISWIRRTRLLWRVFTEVGDPPFIDNQEEYEVDVFDNGNVVRTIAVSDAASVVYTAAQQTTDGLTPGDPVRVKVYEMSPFVGRGNPLDATI